MRTIRLLRDKRYCRRHHHIVVVKSALLVILARTQIESQPATAAAASLCRNILVCCSLVRIPKPVVGMEGVYAEYKMYGGYELRRFLAMPVKFFSNTVVNRHIIGSQLLSRNIHIGIPFTSDLPIL